MAGNAQRFAATPKRGAAGRFGRWKVEVVDGRTGARLDVVTLRAGEAIAALLNGAHVEGSTDGVQRRYEVLPQAEGWLVVRLERHLTAKYVARTADERLAAQVAWLLTRHAPALEPPARRSLLRLGMHSHA